MPADGAARNTLAHAAIPLSDNFDPWVHFMETVRTKLERGTHVRYRKLREKLCEMMLHRVFGSHAADNAFFGLDFGCNREGIFRATLTDILHTIEEATIRKFLKVFYGLMGDKQRARVDNLVESLFGQGNNRSSERHSYPKVSFIEEHTQLTRLSANERLGQLFVLAVLLQTKEGQSVLGPRFALKFDEKRAQAREKMKGREQVDPESSDDSDQGRHHECDGESDGCSESGGEGDKGEGGYEEGEGEYAKDAGEGENAEGVGGYDEGAGECNEDDGGYDEDYGEGGCDKDDGEESGEDDDSISEEVKDDLNSLDLSHMHEGMHPCLETFHKKRFTGCLRQVLTKRNVSKIRKVNFPDGVLDHRNVKRPMGMKRPAACSFEKEHADFEVSEARRNNSIKLPMEEFVCLVETPLSLTSFLKHGYNLLASRPSASVECDKALELFLRMLASTVERAESTNQWCLQKTLEMVHFKEDILSHGPASGFSTETGERGLKPWAKHPSWTAQRRGDEIFAIQVCERIHETAILNRIADSLPLAEDEDELTTRNFDDI
jgi:hypothetical protein